MFTAVKNFFLKDIVLAVRDIGSMNYLNQLHSQYLPWTGSSISPTALRYILNDIMMNDRDIIVECGSGISSIYIASLLKQIGSEKKRLYSIEHDENWISILQREIDQNTLSDYVTFIHAPLKHCTECLSSELTWYDTDAIQEHLSDKNIDLLFVDGPMANKKALELSRYPALPFLKNKLSNKFLVLLHDAHRKGEKLIAAKWSEELGINFRQSILDGNFYIGLRGDSYNVI